MEHELALRLAHFATRHGTDAYHNLGPSKDLFPEQKAFFEDPSRFKNAICSRRAGKTHSASGGLLEAASIQADAFSVYIGLTRKSAKRIIWKTLKEHNELYGYNGTVSETDLSIKLSNKAEAFCVGADQEKFVERIRGLPIKRAIIDEAQAFRPDLLEYLIDDVLTPALMDYDGDCWLIGTPGPTPSGFFYEACQPTNKGWSTHSWTVFDNPHIPNAKEFLDEYLQRKNWTEEHPTIQREWYGKWVNDPDSLVYKFKKPRNVFKQLRSDVDWYYTLGIDYGWHDKTAFAIAAYSHKHPKVYITYARAYGKMIPSQIARFVKKLQHSFEVHNIVADTGGLGKSITEELRIRYGIHVEPAQKTEKLSHIELMNGDFITENLYVHEECTELIHQYETLIFDDRGLEDQNLPNDLCDAALYAYRKSKHYAYEKPESTAHRNSEDYHDKQQEIEIERMERQDSGESDWIEEEYGDSNISPEADQEIDNYFDGHDF